MSLKSKPENQSEYIINDNKITAVTVHRDLGVNISSDQSWSQHIKLITARAYKILGLLRRTFSSYHLTGKKKILYISLVKSQILYCSQIWRPRLIKNIKILEQVQRRATKWILNDYEMDYKDRLVVWTCFLSCMFWNLTTFYFVSKA